MDKSDTLHRRRAKPKAKLNKALVTSGEIYGAFMAADSSRVVYFGDIDTVNVVEVYSCLPDGPSQIKLNGTVTTGGTVENGELTTDGSRAVFWGDVETDGVVEIYSVTLSGTGRTKLNQALVIGGSLNKDRVQVSPDGTKVAYVADAETDEVLYEASTVDSRDST